MKRFDEKILKDILFWAKDQHKGNKWNAAFQNIGKMWKFDQLGPKYMGPTGFVRYLTELPHIHLSEADRDRVFNFNLELNRKDSSLFEQISEGSPDNFYIDHNPQNWIYDQAVFSYEQRGYIHWMAYMLVTVENTPNFDMIDQDHPVAACFLGLPVESDSRLKIKNIFWPIAFQNNPLNNELDSWSLMDGNESEKDESMLQSFKELNENAGDVISHFTMLHNYLKYSDKHAVEASPTKEKKYNKSLHAKRPWAGPSGPKVLLLDRIPTPGCPTGEGSPKKSHMRRGHWRTLSHPRYRHHPQYQEKIWVKPAFIGPESATYQGNFYRLVQPLEEIMEAA